MSMLSRLALLFVGVPLLELFILIQMGQVVGFWPTMGLVVLTGMAGAGLARREGLRTLLRIQEQLGRGQLPGSALLDGLGILMGGALLLTPGILTDLAGFAFLFPPTRRFLLNRIRKRMERGLQSGTIQVLHVGGVGPAGWQQGQGPGTPESDPVRPPRPGEIIIDSDHSEEEPEGDSR